jgi:hypothetical protein
MVAVAALFLTGSVAFADNPSSGSTIATGSTHKFAYQLGGPCEGIVGTLTVSYQASYYVMEHSSQRDGAPYWSQMSHRGTFYFEPDDPQAPRYRGFYSLNAGGPEEVYTTQNAFLLRMAGFGTDGRVARVDLFLRITMSDEGPQVSFLAPPLSLAENTCV